MDMGNMCQLLTTQPDWALKVIHSMEQHTTQLRHKVAAFERDEERPLGECGCGNHWNNLHPSEHRHHRLVRWRTA